MLKKYQEEAVFYPVREARELEDIDYPADMP